MKKKDSRHTLAAIKSVTLCSFLHLVVISFLLIVETETQNNCKAIPSNDRIFTGKFGFYLASSNLIAGMIKPGINTYAISPGVISQITLNDNNPIDYTRLQITHSTLV